MNYCKIRKDLVDSKTAVPIEKIGKKQFIRFIHGDAKREYRWCDDNNFQIFFGDSWWRACSIDFDFMDTMDYRFNGQINCDKCKFFPDCKSGESNCPYLSGWEDSQDKLLKTAPEKPKGGQ